MKKKGISLIVLIITIVVIIILAAAIILSLGKTNVITNADNAVKASDVKTAQEAFTLWMSDRWVKNRNEIGAVYNGKIGKDTSSLTATIKGVETPVEVTTVDLGLDNIDEVQIDKNVVMNIKKGDKVITNTPTVPNEPEEEKDTVAPTVPEIVVNTTDTTITIEAKKSTDNVDSTVTYEYSIDNKNWQESGEFTGLTKGTAYTVYARAKDSTGNVSNSKTENLEVGIITTKMISNSPKMYYGKKVNYTTGNSTVDTALQTDNITWKIFHATKDNIYLIASDYVQSSTLPLQNKITKVSGSNYRAHFTGTVSSYNGSTNIIDVDLKALNNDYFTKNYTSGNNNMKSVAYLMDTNLWKSNYANNTNAKYAIGGPTLEMLFDSYNKMYDVTFESQASSATGYQIRKSPNDNWVNGITSEMLDISDVLYIQKSKEKAHAYWIASPSADNINYILGANSVRLG